MTNAQGDIRLLLADVDGTLVTQDKVLTDQAVAATRELHEAGITLALTSGRPPRGMSMLIAPLRLEGAIAGFNGGVFVHPDLSVIESHLLDAATARETLQLILDQGLDAWVYTENEWLIRDAKAPHVARETWTVKFDAKVVSSFTDAIWRKWPRSSASPTTSIASPPARSRRSKNWGRGPARRARSHIISMSPTRKPTRARWY